MSNHELNRTIKLNENADNSLYSWHLQEYDSEGNKVGYEFIPMQTGSIYLDVEKLSYRNHFRKHWGDESESSEFSESEHIYGELKTRKEGSFWWRTTNTFSMFGTDREIKYFNIEIHKTDDGQKGDTASMLRTFETIDSKKEGCYLTGYVGRKDDGDIDVEPSDAKDSLYISVYLNEERFNKIVQYIKDGVNANYISIGHAEGFYNQWTPSINLGDIKVLSDYCAGFGKDEPYVQQVEAAKECDITPPRTGRLFDFVIDFKVESNIFIDDDKENEDEDVYEDDYEIDNPVKLESSTDVISSQLSQISDLGLKLSKFSLDALRLPLWIIAITLLLILIYK